MGSGDCLGAEIKTGAGTGTCGAAEDSGTAVFTAPGVVAETGITIAFSIRLCTLEGSMTCWLSSGGGVGPMSLLLALYCASIASAFIGSADLLWLS